MRFRCRNSAYVLTAFLLLAACEPYQPQTKQTEALYSGRILFHEDMGPDPTRRLACYRGAQTGNESANTVPIGDDGVFAIYAPPAETTTYYDLYAFYDTNGDGRMSYLDDRICYLITQDASRANHAIFVRIVKLSGRVRYHGDDGRFDFSSSTNPPILAVEDQSYWRTTYERIGRNGDFVVFVAQNHLVDLKLYHVSRHVDDYAERFDENLLFPVRLAGTRSYEEDTRLRGIGRVPKGQSRNPDTVYYTIFVHQLRVRIVNPYHFPDHDIVIYAGQVPYAYRLFDDEDTAVRATQTPSDGTEYSIYYRDFDRTTETDGALNDRSLYSRRVGYGGFFRAQAFIDLNNDRLPNPEDVASNVFYYGDINGNSIPDWGPGDGVNEVGDYSDTISASYIASDKDFTSGGEGKNLVLGR